MNYDLTFVHSASSGKYSVKTSKRSFFANLNDSPSENIAVGGASLFGQCPNRGNIFNGASLNVHGIHVGREL